MTDEEYIDLVDEIEDKMEDDEDKNEITEVDEMIQAEWYEAIENE